MGVVKPSLIDQVFLLRDGLEDKNIDHAVIKTISSCLVNESVSGF